MNIAALLLLAVACMPWHALSAPAPGFQVFDATLYRDKPDLGRQGLAPIEILYASAFWPDTRSAGAMDALPDERTVRRRAREARALDRPVVIDIEHWPLDGADERMRGYLAKYITVLQWTRSEAPGLNIGYFELLPMVAYGWALAAPGSRDHQRWQHENARRGALAPFVDAVYPHLYTYYPDRRAWTRYAEANLREARRYGKPVYAFLWPQYSERNAELGQRYLPEDFWRLQLETVRDLADGIVIWGGWDGAGGAPAAWDESAPWWRVTREFMRTLRAPEAGSGGPPGGTP